MLWSSLASEIEEVSSEILQYFELMQVN